MKEWSPDDWSSEHVDVCTRATVRVLLRELHEAGFSRPDVDVLQDGEVLVDLCERGEIRVRGPTMTAFVMVESVTFYAPDEPWTMTSQDARELVYELRLRSS